MPDPIASASKKHADSHFAVGVFDSGIGGLSVLRHIRQRLPDESLLYFADSSFAPYGDKTESEIISRSLAAAGFLITKNIKALVVACNTATAAAIATLRQRYPHLIMVGIEPGLKPAAQQSISKVVGVLATQSTLQSQKFTLLRDQLSREMGVRFVSQACIGLANQIEKGELNTHDTLQLVRHYVTPLLHEGADRLVLGCTHYPFVSHLINAVIAETSATSNAVQLIDTGEAVARQLQRLLEQHQMRHSDPALRVNTIRAWTTGDSSSLEHALQHMLGLLKEEYEVFALK
ncbi:MAG: glutamate racemase [Undibacterium sp.]|nr:glutamate racemase [Undibacterium sp.]